MRKIIIVAYMVVLCFYLWMSSLWIEAEKSGEYITVGTIETPMLVALQGMQNQYCASSRRDRDRVKGVLIEGHQRNPKTLSEYPEVKMAIRQSIPIVIANPTQSEIQSVTGFSIDEVLEAMIIIPRKNGNEFEMMMVGSHQWDFSKASVNERKKTVRTISSIVDQHQLVKQSGDIDSNAVFPHRRWTVLDAKAHVWGKQKQYIHVGFQYDLYYVCNPRPARKYLLLRTIGSGVSSGKVKNDHHFHRGYYQNKVMVDVRGYPHGGWMGSNLKLEEYAPQSENTLNQDQNTTGAMFSLNGIIGTPSWGNTSVQNSGIGAGISLYNQHGVTSKFDDFSVSFEPTATSDRWVFWMNGAQGARIRRDHQTRDLIRCRYGITTIRELPQLANDSVLQPDVEALYYTHGDQTGKWTVVQTIGQYLQDVAIRPLWINTKTISRVISRKITIDFSQVNDQANETCKK